MNNLAKQLLENNGVPGADWQSAARDHFSQWLASHGIEDGHDQNVVREYVYDASKPYQAPAHELLDFLLDGGVGAVQAGSIDADRNITDALTGYGDQLDDICGILFQIGGDVYGQLVMEVDEADDAAFRDKIVDAMLGYIRERVSSNASAL